MKKAVLFFLTLLLCLAFALGGVSAAEGDSSCGEGLTWTLSDKGVLTVSGNGKITSHPWAAENVKEVILQKGVTSICSSAFKDCTALTKVTLPDTLVEIGNTAFYNCSSLTEITLPDSVKALGGYSALPEDAVIHVSSEAAAALVSQNYHPFRMKGRNYSLQYLYDIDGKQTGTEISQVESTAKSFTVPDQITKIGWCAFKGCPNLTSVTLPKGLQSIDRGAFIYCSELKEIRLPDNITSCEWCFSDSTVLYANPDSVTAKTLSMNDYAFRKDGTHHSIRYQYDESGSRTGCLLVSVDSSLSAFTIPSDITGIAPDCFARNTKLQTVTVPATLTKLGQNAFAQYGGHLHFQGKAPEIAADAFEYASVVAYYPHDDSSWANTILDTYGASTLIWRADNEKKPEDKPKDQTETLKQEETNNESGQNVTWTTASPVNSYLTANDDGTFFRVEHTGESVIIEQYASDMSLKWKKTLTMELPLWGGFFSGKDYHFLVEGQNNPDEDDSVEVMRVIRYSKNWHRIDSVSILGHNTIRPFRAGSLRMAESNDFLYIHTCHQMYKSGDGLNHQANMSYQIYIPKMVVTRENYLVSNDYYDYVSHSFDQHVLIDGADIIKVDHGDAYPRAITLMKIADSASSPGYGETTRVTLLPISGETGNNYTGVSVGGLTASSSHYIIAGTSVDQALFDTAQMQNLFIVTVPKAEPEDSKVRFRWITSYREDSGISVSTPQIVKISGSSSLLLWTETPSENPAGKVLKYLFLKEDGTASSEIYSADGRLSDCKPIVKDGKVIWYVTDDSGSVFFIIDPADPSTVRKAAHSSWVKLSAGWYYYNEKGEMVTGWLPLDGKTYYMDATGLMVTGPQFIDGKQYLFAESGEALTDQWYTAENGDQFYLGADGAGITGFADLLAPFYNWDPEDKDRYYFNENGVMQTGWQVIDQKTYYFGPNGIMYTGWFTDENDAEYYLDENGVMQTGWITLKTTDYRYDPAISDWVSYEKDVLYYLGTDGKKATGWQNIDQKTYYFDADGVMRTGWVSDENGAEYYLDESGVMQTGWLTRKTTDYRYDESLSDWVPYEKDVFYYLGEDGKKVTGWQQIGQDYYYFLPDGLMKTGWHYDDNGTKYYLNDDGKMVTDSVILDGYIYYFDASGAYTGINEPAPDPNALRGWVEEAGAWKYYAEDGSTVTGWLQLDGAWYYMNADGIMQTGWVQAGGAWYYMNASGVMQTGWVQAGGAWYYMNASGVMQTGWVEVGGAWYYMNAGGTMQTGWLQSGSSWYYLKSSGVMATGWTMIRGTWYYFDPSGLMATGWQQVGSAWYYFRASGAMVTGWFEDTDAENALPEGQRRALWYWFDDSGAMATGWKEIGGQWEMFDDSGLWLYTWNGQ